MEHNLHYLVPDMMMEKVDMQEIRILSIIVFFS